MPKGIYTRPSGYRPRKNDPPQLVEMVKARYESGSTQVEIAQELGRTVRFVQGIFKRNGIKARIATKRDQTGERNSGWKGNAAGYQALHLRVYRLRGKPFPCQVCGTTTAKAYDWANLTGNYQDPSDYKAMCRSCHWKFDDKVQNLRKEVMPKP